MYFCCVLCLMQCYPILSQPYPIQCYPTPSYPITLDDIISHPGSFLSYLILSNLIVFYPKPKPHRIVPFHPIRKYPASLLYCTPFYHIVFVCSHLSSLCNMVQPPHLTPLPPHFHPLLLDEIVHRAVLPSG